MRVAAVRRVTDADGRVPPERRANPPHAKSDIKRV